jgi:hypothetical protein
MFDSPDAESPSAPIEHYRTVAKRWRDAVEARDSAMLAA